MGANRAFYLIGVGILGLGIFILLLVGFWACSSGGGNTSSSGGTGTTGGPGTGGSNGTLTVNLTDTPFNDAQAVLVTFSEVQAHHSGSGWIIVPFAGGYGSRTCDLRRLVGGQDILGTGSLPSGHYTQIRLVVTQSTLYFDSPTSGPVCAPSITAPSENNDPLEISSGEIKLNREFDLPAGGGSTLLLDFDGDKSIHKTGNDHYKMNPVISVVSVQ